MRRIALEVYIDLADDDQTDSKVVQEFVFDALLAASSLNMMASGVRWPLAFTAKITPSEEDSHERSTK